MNSHPKETDLALLAGGDCGRVSRFLLNRHLRNCRECTATVAHFEMLRVDLADMAEPDLVRTDLDWNRLAAEMKANIHLGLEAGECVRSTERPRQWNPRLAVAFASLTFLVGAGLLMKSSVAVPQVATSTERTEQGSGASRVLESSGAGLELRDGASSITLLNRNGSVADQTVSAEGEIRARSIQNGAVTINNVSLE